MRSWCYNFRSSGDSKLFPARGVVRLKCGPNPRDLVEETDCHLIAGKLQSTHASGGALGRRARRTPFASPNCAAHYKQGAFT
jgi:hypothetical protein